MTSFNLTILLRENKRQRLDASVLDASVIDFKSDEFAFIVTTLANPVAHNCFRALFGTYADGSLVQNGGFVLVIVKLRTVAKHKNSLRGGIFCAKKPPFMSWEVRIFERVTTTVKVE